MATVGEVLKEQQAWQDQVRFELDKPVRVRIFYGCKLGSQIFYPTIDPTTGQTKRVSIFIPRRENIFTRIQQLDELQQKEKILATHGGNTVVAQEAIKKVRSKFSPRNRWYFLAFQRGQGPKIRILPLPYSLWLAYQTIKEEPSIDAMGNMDLSKLRHGPPILYDLVIMKRRSGQSANPQFDTYYTMQPTDNPYAGKIDSIFFDYIANVELDGSMVLISNRNPEKKLQFAPDSNVFVKEEVAAILEMKPNFLDEFVQTGGSDYIQQKLESFPIFVHGLDHIGAPYYEDADLIKSVLNSLNVPMISQKAQISAPAASTMPSTATSPSTETWTDPFGFDAPTPSVPLSTATPKVKEVDGDDKSRPFPLFGII